MEAIIENGTDAFNFVYGGRGKFTLVSKKTGKRFTYHIKTAKAKDNNSTPLMFVRVLDGPCNQSDYRYIGFINPDNVGLIAGRKGLPNADSFRALNWAIHKFAAAEMPDELEIWHSGACGACGRELTVPESIATGLGPVCAKKV